MLPHDLRHYQTEGMGPIPWVAGAAVAIGLSALFGWLSQRDEGPPPIDQATLARIVEQAGCTGRSWPTILTDGEGVYKVTCVEAVRNCYGCRARLAEAR